MATSTCPNDSSPIIDIDSTVDQLQLTKDEIHSLLNMIISDLPNTKTDILSAVNDIDSMRNHLHKLLGGTSYCKLPHVDYYARELQSICHEKTMNSESFKSLTKNLCEAIDEAIKEYEAHYT